MYFQQKVTVYPLHDHSFILKSGNSLNKMSYYNREGVLMKKFPLNNYITS